MLRWEGISNAFDAVLRRKTSALSVDFAAKFWGCDVKDRPIAQDLLPV